MNDSGSSDKRQTSSLKVTYEAQYGVSHLKKRCADDSTAVAKCKKLSRNLVSSTNSVAENELIASIPSGCHANSMFVHGELATGSLYDIEDILIHRMNIEVENFRDTLHQAISDQFSQVHHQMTIKPQTDNNDAAVPELSEREELVANNEVVMYDGSMEDNTVYSPVDSGVCCTETLSIDHELDLYVLRLLTAMTVISNTLSNKL